MNAPDSSPADSPQGNPPLPAGWLSRYPWATFLLPLAVFMVATGLEPTPPDDSAADAGSGYLGVAYRWYPVVYAAKLALVVVAMLAVLPGYRAFRGRVSGLAWIVGLVGAVLWIGLSELHLEQHLKLPESVAGILGLGPRSAYNPLVELADNKPWAYVFLALRLIGLALVVPVIEEFFLRGFLMRFVMHPNWWQVPFGDVNRLAVIVGTAFPVLTHPEKLAALVWFSLITWLMVRTRNIWDCVVAHGVTNAALGAYVLATNHWELM